MAANSPNSPRQKMINLMYLVFIAMLALNVSADVLNGFDKVEDGLRASTANLSERNTLILDELGAYNDRNPDKAGEWYGKGRQVRAMSDSLSTYIESLKVRMVQKADGKKGDVTHIKKRDDVEAASVVMLSPIDGQGRILREAVDAYRTRIAAFLPDNGRKRLIENNLDTGAKGGKSWEASLFEHMPVSAAVTLLSKLQNDIRSAEGEALDNLLSSVDVGDFRVNRVNAYVIPESDVVIQGGTYNARIVLSAEDSTKYPAIRVNGRTLDASQKGVFSASAGSVGTFPVEGYIELPNADGSVLRRTFQSRYTVIEPMATIAPVLMNVLYAGIDNEISISVPGFAPQDVTATMTNGTLARRGSLWVARPSAVGQNATVSIAARTGSQSRTLMSKEFRVRALPDPTPYIEYTDGNGNPAMFKGGALSKAVLMNADGIKAAIDDGILNIPFRVKSFRTVFFDSMGNAIPEVSDGSRFSARQKEQMRRLARGNYFYISGVMASGPDATEREIAVIEVRVR
ncbi:MAG TPA: gliding motility protein GldM [Porphyromonadaceae bacterium]|mgnify:CR=1 FL=1|nr:gliding motility protein GldM [Porphyromonadaceae bacterium]